MKTGFEYRQNRKIFRFLLLIFAVNICIGRCFHLAAADVRVDIKQNLQRLIRQEDTDGDKKITVDDHFERDERGDEKFEVVDVNGHRYEVLGSYYLSNLLQQLKLSEKKGQTLAKLDPDKIFENPVTRISRCIKDIYWNSLTRRIDEKNIVSIFEDSKTTTFDGYRYIYVPPEDKTAYRYFRTVAEEHPKLKIRVVRLPENITPEWVKSRNGYHGLLTLGLQRGEDGTLRGVPFVVPGGRFNEMYGWDSYFIAMGLLEDGRAESARSMVDNLVYEINHYGKIVNANRSYYLTRSQPPFLTSMALAVYEHLPENAENKQWLKKVFRAAIREYNNVWMSRKRLTETGLSRYYGNGIGQPPEVEPGHFDHIYQRYAGKYDMDVGTFKDAYRAGDINVPELDEYFVHDRAMRESGHDTTYRWGDRCADFVTVDLNSLLYKIETDIAETIKNEFGDSLKLENGKISKSRIWYKRAEKRKALMNKYLWDSEHGLFLDYDLANQRRKLYITPVSFYPLWAGLADRQQAQSIVNAAVEPLEMPGGLAASSKESRPGVSEDKPARQWDYPYGWAPHQMLAWRGLTDYGFEKIAQRLIYRWLYTITINARNYNGTIPEKFNVVTRSHRVFAEYGNVGTEFDYITREGFGWMNASYQVGLRFLQPARCEKLKKSAPPEWIFEK